MSYAICPYEWLQDKNIKNEVTLLMIIANLTNDKGFCWASNSYFAELLNETTVNISRKLKKLKEQNYISISYSKDEKRKIVPLTKLLIPLNKIVKGGLNKNVKHNNISNNNINNNISNLFRNENVIDFDQYYIN